MSTTGLTLKSTHASSQTSHSCVAGGREKGGSAVQQPRRQLGKAALQVAYWRGRVNANGGKGNIGCGLCGR